MNNITTSQHTTTTSIIFYLPVKTLKKFSTVTCISQCAMIELTVVVTPYLIPPVVHLYVISIHINVLIGIVEDSCYDSIDMNGCG